MQKKYFFHIVSSFLCAVSVNIQAEVAPAEAYYLKLGTFSKSDNAKQLKQKLHSQYHVEASLDQKKQFTIVSLGPYSDKQSAIKFRESHEFAKNGLIIKANDKIKLSRTEKNTPPKQPTSHTLVKQINETTKTKQKGQSLNNTFNAKPTIIKRPKPSTKLWNLRLANIRSVIQAVSQVTGKNFLIDPRVQGKISIVSSKPINSEELYQVFLSMLQVAGYAAIPSGEVIKIVPNIDARSIGGDSIKTDIDGRGDEMIVKVVPIQFVSAEQLVPVIRPLMPQWSNVSAYSPSNMLILSGRADNIQRLSYIIEQVDNSSSNGIDTVQLHNALAMDVVATIKALTDNQKNRIYQHNATIAADDKSNTILISGSKPERLRIRLLINQLDKRNANNMGNTEVIYLRYLKAQDILPILSGVAKANFSGSVGTTIGTITDPPLDSSTPTNSMGAGTDDGGNSSTNSSYSSSPNLGTINNANLAQNTQAGSDSSEGNSKPKVQIIADPNSNAIILSAPQALMRTFKTLIAKLDSRPAQVLVEALITEIDEDDINQLGLQWGTVSSDGNTRQFTPGFAIISNRMSLSNFQARLTALVQNNKANILSTPSVVVLDNRQAKILVGQNIAIQDSSYPGNAGGAGQTNPFTTFTRKNVALHLYVRPQISQGSSIQLQIDHGNDTLPDNIPNNVTSGLPVINTSSIQTSVLVKSGDVLVLGGLVQNQRLLRNNRIPILGEIPGIGRAFQDNTRRKRKKVLMVFIRPIIMENNRTSLQVTGSKYFKLRQQQLDWMRYKPYDPANKQMVFKPLKKSAKLPVPFASGSDRKTS